MILKHSAVLLISCPDAKGIVAKISQFIFANNGNIVRSDQHSDEESGTFFMRIEWDLENFAIEPENIHKAFQPIADNYAMDWQIHFSDKKQRMAIYVSKMDHCLYDIILKAKEGEFNAHLSCIISNHESLRAIAHYFNIPFFVFPKTKETKLEQEKKELHILADYNIDCIVLARYMQIMSPEFVVHYPNKIINIHHSFLPAFKGAKPYHQAHHHGVKIIGATSHYVTDLLDQGPIIEQDIIRVSHKDSVLDLVRKGKDIEKLVLSRAVKKHLEHKVLVYANKTIVFD